jgi:hypothetical protein
VVSHLHAHFLGSKLKIPIICRLKPNETPQTDVILLGHSMGGILAAEVALLPPHSPATGQPFRHRILGTIGFDTPYLGMHPGVIVSGISSLFRPAPKPPEFNPQPQKGSPGHSGRTSPSSPSSTSISSTSATLDPILSPQTSASVSTILSPTLSRASTMSTVPTNDPYYDPPFPNDKHLVERKGWSSVLHFINKHSNGLMKATEQYFMSHLEFGGCLADYPGLRNRYAKIRELEDVDDLSQREGPGYKPPIRRVRFVNYWTASTGIPNKPRLPSGQMVDKDGHLMPLEAEMKDMSLSDTSSRSATPTPNISVEEYSDGVVTRHNVAEFPEPEPSAIETQMQNLGRNSGVHEAESNEPPEMRHVDSLPIDEDEEPTSKAEHSQRLDSADLLDSAFERRDSEPPVPPLPAVPAEPRPIDLSIYTDKDSRKLAEKEQKRVMKAYQQAVKDRENAIKDRRKLVEKRQKKSRQEQEKRLKAEQKQRLKEEKDEDIRQMTINPPPAEEVPKEAASKAEKPKKDGKFCMMPPEVNGKKDKCWIRVYMAGVDEVGAHCGLFFPGAHYESLVGDVGARVEEWVKEDATRRVILEGGDGGPWTLIDDTHDTGFMPETL